MPLPTITAIAQPVAGTVMITVNYSAIPNAKYARIVRVEVNGTRTPVRCNTSTDSSGTYMELSGGIAILYDCEAPRDVSLYYVTDALDANGAVVMTSTVLLYDNFNSSLDGWTVHTNNAITLSTTQVLNGTSSMRVVSSAAGDSFVRTVPSQCPTAPGNTIQFSAWVYPNSALSNFTIQMNWYDSTSTLLGGGAVINPVPTLTTGAWNFLTMSAEAVNNTAFVAPKFDWTATAGGQIMYADSVQLLDQEALIPASSTSSEVILGSSGFLALSDPINPANNLRIVLSPPTFALPECQPGEGIYFSGMADRTYGTQTTNWNVNNSSTPLPLSQVRQKAVGGIQLITRTFGDSDALTRLTASGNALWMFVPDKYGFESGVYLSVGDVGLTRVSRDQRRQWQIATLPWVIVGRIGGLSYGILGTRWQDLCTPYTTIDAANAAGVTWQQVLTGSASVTTSNLSFRTWQQVKNTFPTWSAVNNGRTWQQLLAGQ